MLANKFLRSSQDAEHIVLLHVPGSTSVVAKETLLPFFDMCKYEAQIAAFVFGVGVLSSMARTSKSQHGQLAQKWERLVRVRNRFRNGLPWLKLHLSDDGKTPMPATTKSFQNNAEILSVLLQTTGLQKQPVKYLRKQAGFE